MLAEYGQSYLTPTIGLSLDGDESLLDIASNASLAKINIEKEIYKFWTNRIQFKVGVITLFALMVAAVKIRLWKPTKNHEYKLVTSSSK